MKGLSVENKGESVLRNLRKVQLSVPDKDFIAHVRSELKGSEAKKKKPKKSGGLLSGVFGGRKSSSMDLEVAREKIKSFNNSFRVRKRTGGKELIDPSLMSVQEMKDFRGEVKTSAEAEVEGFGYRGLAAIVKYIDLKNSGVTTGKQDVLLDCLKNLALALVEDGGLSMFHATWFLTVYKEYLIHYKMFKPGEFERVSNTGGAEGKKIARGLFQKQYEIPLYLQLVHDNKRDVKQLVRYSKDPYVKRSAHGQKGCSRAHIQKIFTDVIQGNEPKGSENYLNEVNVIMAYGMFFSRIPMMKPLVESIMKAIPNLGIETTLYREKLGISQKLIDLEIHTGVARNDGSDAHQKRLFDSAYGIYKECTNLITDNRLTADSIKSDIHTFPFLRQAIILITYRNMFMKQKKTFLKMVENSLSILENLSDAARSGQRSVLKIIEYVDVYQRNLEAIAHQIKSDTD